MMNSFWFVTIVILFIRNESFANSCTLRENPIGNRFITDANKMNEVCLPSCKDNYEERLKNTEDELINSLTPLGFEKKSDSKTKSYENYKSFLLANQKKSNAMTSECFKNEQARTTNKTLGCLNSEVKSSMPLKIASEKFAQYENEQIYLSGSEYLRDFGLSSQKICLLRKHNLIWEAIRIAEASRSRVQDAKTHNTIVSLIAEKLTPQKIEKTETENEQINKFCNAYKSGKSFPVGLGPLVARYCH